MPCLYLVLALLIAPRVRCGCPSPRPLFFPHASAPPFFFHSMLVSRSPSPLPQSPPACARGGTSYAVWTRAKDLLLVCFSTRCFPLLCFLLVALRARAPPHTHPVLQALKNRRCLLCSCDAVTIYRSSPPPPPPPTRISTQRARSARAPHP